MIADLQPGEVVIAEKIDPLSRLPLAEAEQLVASIRTKGAKLAVPGLVDLSDFAAGTEGVARIVLDSVQNLLLKLALQMARDDYETRRERQRQGVQLAKAAGKYAGRTPDTTAHQRIVAVKMLWTCRPQPAYGSPARKNTSQIHLAGNMDPALK
jgi:DNA invertase Pin-like site-specific DNA recombinase